MERNMDSTEDENFTQRDDCLYCTNASAEGKNVVKAGNNSLELF